MTLPANFWEITDSSPTQEILSSAFDWHWTILCDRICLKISLSWREYYISFFSFLAGLSTRATRLMGENDTDFVVVSKLYCFVWVHWCCGYLGLMWKSLRGVWKAQWGCCLVVFLWCVMDTATYRVWDICMKAGTRYFTPVKIRGKKA